MLFQFLEFGLQQLLLFGELFGLRFQLQAQGVQLRLFGRGRRSLTELGGEQHRARAEAYPCFP